MTALPDARILRSKYKSSLSPSISIAPGSAVDAVVSGVSKSSEVSVSAGAVRLKLDKKSVTTVAKKYFARLIFEWA